MARVNPHTRIAFFHSKMKIPFVTGNFFKTAIHVWRLRFEFLYANTILLGLRQPVFKAFTGSRTDTVQVQAG